MKPTKADITADEKYYMATQWQLMWRKLKKHKLAILGGSVLIAFYLVAILCEFISPYDKATRHPDYILSQPQRVRLQVQ